MNHFVLSIITAATFAWSMGLSAGEPDIYPGHFASGLVHSPHFETWMKECQAIADELDHEIAIVGSRARGTAGIHKNFRPVTPESDLDLMVFMRDEAKAEQAMEALAGLVDKKDRVPLAAVDGLFDTTDPDYWSPLIFSPKAPRPRLHDGTEVILEAGKEPTFITPPQKAAETATKATTLTKKTVDCETRINLTVTQKVKPPKSNLGKNVAKGGLTVGMLLQGSSNALGAYDEAMQHNGGSRLSALTESGMITLFDLPGYIVGSEMPLSPTGIIKGHQSHYYRLQDHKYIRKGRGHGAYYESTDGYTYNCTYRWTGWANRAAFMRDYEATVDSTIPMVIPNGKAIIDLKDQLKRFSKPRAQ